MASFPKEPVDWFELFHQQMDELFRFLFSLERKGALGERENVPLVDIYETADEYVVEIDLPGFSVNNLNLRICYHVLVVEGVKSQDEPGDAVKYTCLERNFGRFCRAIEIPPMVDLDKVKAHYSDRGVLSVRFPKIADKTLLVREIPIE